MRVCAALLLFAALAAGQLHPVPMEEGSARFGAGIQRTMSLLAASTPARRIPVRVLFYGQSITKQQWSRQIAEDLRRRFPFADLTIENRAIGGYSSPFLVQTVAHDVYGFYPDLVIFHDFGDHENYEKIIAGIRSHTTAEILIQSDFPTWQPVPGETPAPAQIKREAFHDRHSFEWLPQLCAKYSCEVVDVRRPWKQYLTENRLKPGELLSDGTHLNDHGNALLAALTTRHLRHNPEAPAAIWQDLVRSAPIAWQDGRFEIEFEGNRVDFVATPGDGPFHAAEAAVRIDGRKPSEFPSLYGITRPTDTFAVDWPAVNRVTSQSPLVAEDWTLRAFEAASDDSEWKFSVAGSVTGPDGEGVSSRRFVSKSGRVVIEPAEWGVKRAFDLRHIATPAGFEVKWRVVPMFANTIRAPRAVDASREYRTTLALGLSNGKHKLTLVASPGAPPPQGSITIYRPPLRQ